MTGTDGGLRLHDEKNGGVRIMLFQEYLEELSGVRFAPGDLGYADWTTYQPGRPNELANPPTDAQRRDAFLFRDSSTGAG